jgi:copper(I)-binding protein
MFLRTALALVLLNAITHAQPKPSVSDATAQITGNGAVVYATINNPSMYDVYVVSGKSDAAEKIELLDGEKVVTSLTVPAYGSLELKNDGPRVRLSGIKGQLKAGDALKLTLETDGGVSLELAAIVK